MAYRRIKERREDKKMQTEIRKKALKSLEILGQSLVVLAGKDYLNLNDYIKTERGRNIHSRYAF